MSVRRATLGDAEAIAHVHVDAWRAAHKDVMPDAYLASLSVEARTKNWAAWLTCDEPITAMVAEEDGAIVGFASGGPSRDDEEAAEAYELYAIYLRPAVWRKGIGKALHDALLETMPADVSIRLWVLEQNHRARSFYEAQGWNLDGKQKVESIGGAELPHLRYSSIRAATRRR